MNFDKVMLGLKGGRNFSKSNWVNKFITMQIPTEISADIVPKMTSLNEKIKNLISKANDGTISYENQVLLVNINKEGKTVATYYIPTWEDIFAEDWFEC